MMKTMYFTITGMEYYYGSDFLKKGMKVKLVKEPDNQYDRISATASQRISIVGQVSSF